MINWCSKKVWFDLNVWEKQWYFTKDNGKEILMKQRDTNGIVWMQIFPQDKPFDNKLWKLCNMPPYILPSNYFPLMAKQNGVEWEKGKQKITSQVSLYLPIISSVSFCKVNNPKNVYPACSAVDLVLNMLPRPFKNTPHTNLPPPPAMQFQRCIFKVSDIPLLQPNI